LPGPRALAVPVTVADAVLKTVPLEVHVIGNVEAYSTVSVKSLVAGQLERVHFREGEDVKQGQVLFSIDRRPFEATLQQAEANLARDLAQQNLAQVQAKRYTQLKADGIVSQDQYDQARTTAESSEALVRADRAAIETAKIQLDYCTIRAPLEGRTGSLMVHEGNVVKANDIALVVINQINPIYVSFAVPEQHLAAIKTRMAARTLGVTAIIPGEEQQPMYGDLTFVDNTVDQATGTIRLKGTFANSGKRLWPGQFVNVVLTLGKQANSVVVPSQAVQTGQAGTYVFVVKPDRTVEMRPIAVDRSLDGETVVSKGLRAGETVVTDGQLRLVPGARIEVKAPPAGTAGALR
jgi:multidrug efflux system membrane fusion protein